MRKLIMLLCYLTTAMDVCAQSSGSIKVQGDLNKYYPVTWLDGGWGNNVATELSIGRSEVHTDSSWRGSVIAKFRYHTFDWGNGANFIDADIRQGYDGLGSNQPPFIAGWMDVTGGNGSSDIVIWLRGGGTTYYYNANYAVNPVVYDGVQNPLPYQGSNEPALSYKTAPDAYVISAGLSYSGSALFGGNIGVGVTNPRFPLDVSGAINSTVSSGDNFIADKPTGAAYSFRRSGVDQVLLQESGSGDFQIYTNGGSMTEKMRVSSNGNVGIGTTNPQSLLSVNGNVTAKQVTVTQTGWPDFVFKKDYPLKPLPEVEKYIEQNNRLPDIPSAKQIESKGLNLGDMVTEQMQKIEELTLYIIQQDKKNAQQDRIIRNLLEKNERLEKVMIALKKQVHISKNRQ